MPNLQSIGLCSEIFMCVLWQEKTWSYTSPRLHWYKFTLYKYLLTPESSQDANFVVDDDKVGIMTAPGFSLLIPDSTGYWAMHVRFVTRIRPEAYSETRELPWCQLCRQWRQSWHRSWTVLGFQYTNHQLYGVWGNACKMRYQWQ